MTDKVYEIRISNHIDDRWKDWFEAESIQQLEGGVTILLVRVRDQPALHGILEKIRDMNIHLISVLETFDPEK